MKLFYEVIYRYFRAPWDIGAREELVSLVESGRLKPCRAIDLGCGTGENAIYLAQKGFDVTGVDYAEAAIEKARVRARETGVQVNFIVDDLTNLRHVSGTFDFMLDYGVLDDLRLHQREPYLHNMLPLSHLGSRYLLWGFEYPMRWWERFVPFYDIPFYPGEIEERFGEYFEIERIAGKVDYSKMAARLRSLFADAERRSAMRSWLMSLNGAITFSVIAFLTFLGRAFMDWRYEYPYQDPAGNWDTPGALIYMGLAGGWLWGLLAAARGSRRGLIGCLIAVLLLDVAFALATYFFFCPPWTGCTGWPNAWSWNWSNLISGAIAAVALSFQLRQGKLKQPTG